MRPHGDSKVLIQAPEETERQELVVEGKAEAASSGC